MVPDTPTNEMIRAGVVTLGDLVRLDALSSREISDLVEAIWMEMAREHRGLGWVEAEPDRTGSWDLSKVRDNL